MRVRGEGEGSCAGGVGVLPLCMGVGDGDLRVLIYMHRVCNQQINGCECGQPVIITSLW